MSNTPTQDVQSIVADLFPDGGEGRAPTSAPAPAASGSMPGMPGGVKSGSFTPEPAKAPPEPKEAEAPEAAEAQEVPAGEVDIPDAFEPPEPPVDSAEPPIPGGGAPEETIERYAFQAREEKRLRKEAERRVQELESNVGEGGVEEVTRLREQVQTLENELGRENLSKSRAFQDKYDAPMDKIHQSSKAILLRSGVDDADADAALQTVYDAEDLRQREMALDALGVTPALASTILNMSLQRDELVAGRQEALEKWKESRAAVQERHSRERLARDIQEAKEITASAIDTARTEGNPYYTPGGDEWNSVVSHFTEATQSVLERNDPSEISGLVAHGLTFNRLLRQFHSERQRRQALEQQVFGDGGASSPTPARTSAAPAARTRQVATDRISNQEAISRLFPG